MVELQSGEETGVGSGAPDTHGSDSQTELEAREAREREFYENYYEDKTLRSVVRKYYTVSADTLEYHKQILLKDCKGKKFLEYGCGDGLLAFDLARAGAVVSGFDISPKAVEVANRQAQEQGLEIDFQVQNAHKTDYPDNSFDLISGLGILHHLELKLAYPEIARILKPDGLALFYEGLGTNPLINLYRKLTPKMRTPDERPLRMKELYMSRSYFNDVKFKFHHFFTLGAVPFRKLPCFNGFLAWCRWWDNQMFRFLPFMRSQAWISTIILRDPKKS